MHLVPKVIISVVNISMFKKATLRYNTLEGFFLRRQIVGPWSGIPGHRCLCLCHPKARPIEKDRPMSPVDPKVAPTSK